MTACSDANRCGGQKERLEIPEGGAVKLKERNMRKSESLAHDGKQCYLIGGQRGGASVPTFHFI